MSGVASRSLMNTCHPGSANKLPSTLTGIQSAMLKVTIAETPSERRITLSGKLIGPWIQELRRVWEECRAQAPTRKIVCDLNYVIQIDESANPLLVEMMAEGTELVSDGGLNGWLIQALKDGRSHVWTRVAHHNSGIGYSVDAKQRLVTTVAQGTVSAADVRDISRVSNEIRLFRSANSSMLAMPGSTYRRQKFGKS